MTSVIVQPQAQVDIDEALGWYSQRDPTIAGRLMVELDIVFDRIGDNPTQFPVVDDGVRRALLQKFPYSVYFVVAGDLAAVVAVLHQRRRPIDWNRRG